MDRRSLGVQYSSSANLAARIELHQRFSVNAQGLQRWIFERLRLRDGMRVLEIACGAGSLWRENLHQVSGHFGPAGHLGLGNLEPNHLEPNHLEPNHLEPNPLTPNPLTPNPLRLTLSDFSVGMVEATRGVVPGAGFVCCALPDLPFADDSFDLVIANHMLYHVEDRRRGLGDIRRVLRTGGSLFASTNGIDHLREIKALMRDFGVEGGDVSASFTLENGEAQLREVFDSVEREDYLDELRVTEADVLLRYIASFGPGAAAIVDARAREMRTAIERRIADDGAFYVIKSTGSFVARSA
jgi:ubiquinone/menaquinone biosynthesis C-methylase UbiE